MSPDDDFGQNIALVTLVILEANKNRLSAATLL